MMSCLLQLNTNTAGTKDQVVSKTCCYHYRAVAVTFFSGCLTAEAVSGHWTPHLIKIHLGLQHKNLYVDEHVEVTHFVFINKY